MSIFRPPESRNARITLVIMSLILGSLVLGIAALAAIVHPVPYVSGTPTVLSQVAKYVYGHGAFATRAVLLLQGGTMLILVLAANTSFTGFPFLASFAADDSYLPRQLTRRGHRLVFSTGILVLTVGVDRHPARHPGEARQPDRPLRHRGVHRVHHGRGGDGEVPPDPS